MYHNPPRAARKVATRRRRGAPRQQDAQTLAALDMLHAQKAALQNSVRQRLVGIRQRELEYYTLNCRSVGNQAALIAGFAYSGIHYHYLLEHQYGWQLSEEDSIEEVIFLSLLTMSLGCALQVSIWHGRLPIDCTDDHNQPVCCCADCRSGGIGIRIGSSTRAARSGRQLARRGCGHAEVDVLRDSPVPGLDRVVRCSATVVLHLLLLLLLLLFLLLLSSTSCVPCIFNHRA